MIKRLLLTMLGSMLLFPMFAQGDGNNAIFTKPKFSGFAMASYQATFQDGNNSNSFDLRLVRASIEGRILNDFYYKIQGQINGNTTTLGSSPRLVDYFMEWQKFDFFRVKLGQFKRPFTYENPMNPIDQGFMSYSQPISKLGGFSDRVGMHSSNGRDIGLQFQGDFLKNSSGRSHHASQSTEVTGIH